MRTVFIHIPKTAGTSIAEIIGRRFAVDEFCHHLFDEDLERMEEADASRYRAFAGHYTYKTVHALIPDARVFTFLRSPVGRVLSLVRYWRAHPWEWVNENRDYSSCVVFAKNSTLSEILNSTDWALKANINNVYVRTFSAPGHFGPNGKLLVDPQLALSTAIFNAEQILFVGFVEYLDESMRLLFSLLGWGLVPQLPRMNTADDGYFRPERGSFNEVAKCTEMVSEEDLRAIERNVDLDLHFYDHFRKSFSSAYLDNDDKANAPISDGSGE